MSSHEGHQESRERLTAYSPQRRTAFVLCGTGAHGAYHAGALRALQEAGVKVDLLAGHGVGAASAALAAIDGGARLWDANGIWRSRQVTELYRWKQALRLAGWFGIVLALVLITPLAVVGVGMVVLSLGFLMQMIGIEAGASLAASYSSWLAVAFSPANLPTLVPRLVLIILVVIGLVMFVSVRLASRGGAPRRRAFGGWWWRALGAPLDGAPARDLFAAALSGIIRGAAPPAAAPRAALGRRYAEVLGENLGQPGFSEVLMVATDLDARRDVVAALLREPHRQEFLTPRSGHDRRVDVLDLTGIAREHALDIVDAALTPPIVCDPHLVTFSSDSFWRGETHRMCDRAGSVIRLLEESAAAGATQAVIISAIAPSAAPHRLRAPRVDLRGRVGDVQSTAEAASLRDALETARLRFDSLYLICPAHNPIGPFDFAGAYDESSDRHHALQELMERGYEDAYRQFIEPVVGGSGERLARDHVATRDGITAL